MQSNRLILWSSLAALVLCAVPYGCAGKSVGSSGDQEGTHNPTYVEGRNQITDGASFGDAVYQGDGGIRYAEGTSGYTDGSRASDGARFGDGLNHGDGAQFPQGDGVGYQDGECDCADGWIGSDGDNQGDGWNDRGDGGYHGNDSADGNADGWPG